MQFLKRNWFMLLCSMVSLTGIGMMVAFMGCMSEVEARMSEAATLYGSLVSAESNPQNMDTIKRVEEVTERVKREQSQVLNQAIQSNARPPLLEDCFPVMADRNKIPYLFVQEYRNAYPKLMRELNPDAPPETTNFGMPTMEEITLWEEEIQRRLGEEFGQTPDPTALTPAPSGLPWAVRPIQPRPSATGAELSPEELAKQDPQQMASIEKARTLRCYVTRDSFQLHNIYYESGTFGEADMWAAQVLLWIQQDVVKALASVNQAAADTIATRNELLPEGTEPIPIDVSTMPVKHLLLIELTLPADVYEMSVAGFGGGPPQPGDVPMGPMSFTGRSSNETYDVVPFHISLIADQRDLTQVIDAVSNANSYTPLNVNWVALPPTGGPQYGYVYGHEPIVQADLDFEGYFFREAYHYRWPEGGPPTPQEGEPPPSLEDHPFMPQMVRDSLAQGATIAPLHMGFVIPQVNPGGAMGQQGFMGGNSFAQPGGGGSVMRRHGP